MPFATSDDLVARLGLDALTDAQGEQADLLLDLASDLIADAVDEMDKDNMSNPVPSVFRVICIECAVRALNAPAGVRSQQEQLGQYMLSQTFTVDSGGLMLSDIEERRLRNAYFGQTIASPRIPSILEEIVPYNDILPRFPNQDLDLPVLGEENAQ